MKKKMHCNWPGDRLKEVKYHKIYSQMGILNHERMCLVEVKFKVITVH